MCTYYFNRIKYNYNAYTYLINCYANYFKLNNKLNDDQIEIIKPNIKMYKKL